LKFGKKRTTKYFRQKLGSELGVFAPKYNWLMKKSIRKVVLKEKCKKKNSQNCRTSQTY
jgi:hypothetical protein